MKSWKPDRASLSVPIYKSLADQIAEAIRDGRLPDGARLLPQRQLASELDVSVQTVSRAYEELTRRDLLSGAAGRGTFVKRPKEADRGPPFSLQRSPDVVDLSILKPVCEDIHLQHMSNALSRLASSVPHRIVNAFRPERAASHHRAAALQWLRECGVDASPYNVCITNGATSALAVALMTVAPPGSVVATESLGHHSLKPLASYMGIHLVGLDVDADGLIPDAFERACMEREIRALFIQPTAINPPATILSEERRRQVAAIAEKHDVLIIENDALGPLISNRPQPFASITPGRTFYVTSFTKIVMPGLRIGYLVVPQKYIATATNRHLVTNWMATPLLEELATGWVQDGTALNLVHWQRKALRSRHRIFQDILGGMRHSTHPEALHVWMPLPEGYSEASFAAHARSLGVAVAVASSFVTGDEPPYQAIRLSLGSVSEEDLSAGLATIASVLAAPPEAPLLR
ncbi:PLP-dependent aminotransferase family protein [Rhodoligotrophos defluvii]|uniref:MocR-like ectoine utilization transcription factor EhuR n=1 Tax=Rhodoligotrophos defluvii TaxID=2561934 RepID=UPI0010C999DE|nr:PLP-dependent aminotransferase family protein [Rhodoligotrophos defluvii]